MLVASLNVRSGGFDSYESSACVPERLALLQRAVRVIGADVVALIDTFRWVELFSAEQLCELFGYSQAFHCDTADSRVDPRIGLTVLARGSVRSCQPLRIHNRNCLKLEVDNGGTSVLVYVAYADDLSEAVRVCQLEAMLADVNVRPDVPVLIIGDLNSVRPPRFRAVRAVLRLISRALLSVPLPYIAAAAVNLASTKVIPLLCRHGFTDAGATNPAPTFYQRVTRLKLPVRLAIDYAFARGVPVRNFRVYSGGVFEIASDHRPISLEI